MPAVRKLRSRSCETSLSKGFGVVVQPSVKEQIVLAAERLFAEHGLDGVSLRQISAAAGNGNNTAVQYHFGSKERLVQEIFEYRLPGLNERRRLLVARRCPDDLRSWVECHILPILEQGEQEGSHYLSFVAMLQQYGRRDVFERLPGELSRPTTDFVERVGALLGHIPEPLRSHRIAQALAFGVRAASERERTRERGGNVLPFAVHVGDLLDGLVGFLEAPVSPATSSVAGETDLRALALPLHP
ncbi:TetR/AcrR family transcriptional regulator [Streptomyces sp. PSKA54]|uniref:TetR/AcrR family transcriptional regulator n=1 Tax=Streptomyces himalayensis subsp. aureolus TaxID=2758039 RepID=A0A7W2D8F1_9ACTN|nr:TetR/AcrR family transcriptional regulator [Streptomyces himalayensis subsp. aureolus]